MTSMIKWGLAGGGGLVLLLALSKKKRKTSSGGGKTYLPITGDRATAIAARFSVDYNTLFEANGRKAIATGQPVTLPVTAKDLGPRPQAMGKVS